MGPLRDCATIAWLKDVVTWADCRHGGRSEFAPCVGFMWSLFTAENWLLFTANAYADRPCCSLAGVQLVHIIRKLMVSRVFWGGR